MDEKNKNRKMKIIIILCNICFFFLLIGNAVFNVHYSTDDYQIFYSHGYPWYMAITSYRPILATCYWILDLIHINVVKYQVFLGIVLLISFVFSTSKITFIIKDKIKTKNSLKNTIVVNLGTLFIYGNAFISEWFYFTEAYIQWIIVTIFTALAIECVFREQKRIINYLLTLFCLIFIAGSYQVALIQYAVIVLFIILIEQKKIKDIFRELVRTESLVAIAIGIILVCSKMLGYLKHYNTSEARINFSVGSIKTIFIQFIRVQYRIWIEALGTLPKWILAVYLLIFSISFIWIRKKEKKKIFTFLIGSGLICGLVEGMLCIIQIMQGFCWVPMRVCVPIFTIFSILIWNWVRIFEKISILYKKIFVGIWSVFLLINVWNIQVNSLDIIKMNTLDRSSILSVEQMIENYERSTGNIIKKIGFCPDANMTVRYYAYQKNDTTSDIVRAFSRSWSDYSSINFYTGREYERVEVPSEIAKQFASKDWQSLQMNEQMMFDGDTVYIAVY